MHTKSVMVWQPLMLIKWSLLPVWNLEIEELIW